MNKQIKRFSPHQNGKVFAVLMAVSSLIFILPMFAIISLTLPQVDQNGNPIEFPMFLLLAMPFMYLIFGYISVVIGCAIYNFIVKFTGGIEFDMDNV